MTSTRRSSRAVDETGPSGSGLPGRAAAAAAGPRPPQRPSGCGEVSALRASVSTSLRRTSSSLANSQFSHPPVLPSTPLHRSSTPLLSSPRLCCRRCCLRIEPCAVSSLWHPAPRCPRRRCTRCLGAPSTTAFSGLLATPDPPTPVAPHARRLSQPPFLSPFPLRRASPPWATTHSPGT